MIEIDVCLEERLLRVGDVERTLSNYDIRHLRSLADETFGDRVAERVVGEVIAERIEPFIRASGRTVSRATVEAEVREAFSTHLYLVCDPD